MLARIDRQRDVERGLSKLDSIPEHPCVCWSVWGEADRQLGDLGLQFLSLCFCDNDSIGVFWTLLGVHRLGCAQVLGIMGERASDFSPKPLAFRKREDRAWPRIEPLALGERWASHVIMARFHFDQASVEERLGHSRFIRDRKGCEKHKRQRDPEHQKRSKH